MAGEVIRAQLHGADENCVELQRFALRRHRTGEFEQVLDDFLGALSLLKDDAQVLARAFRQIGVLQKQVGETENSRERVIDFMGHSGDELADRRHFFGVHEFGLQHGRIRNVSHYDDDAGHGSLLIAHRAEVDGKLAQAPIPAEDLQIEIVYLLARDSVVEGVAEYLTPGWGHQIHQRAFPQLLLFVTGVVPAAVGITDEPSGIRDQNQALCVVQNLTGEISLTL